VNIIELIIPSHFLSPLFNNDYSGLNDEDINAIEALTNDALKEYDTFFAIDTHNDVGFLTYHDMRSYGVLASDCETVVFDIGNFKEAKA
jgi:hypothetical protein